MNTTPDTYYVLGFDVGGTNTAAALGDSHGDLLAEVRTPTVHYTGQRGHGRVFAQLRDGLAEQVGIDPGLIRAAGLAVAGIIEPGTERVVMAPNVSDRDFDLKSIVGEALGVPTSIENDVNLAAVGEHARGAARGCDNFVLVAIGTGIGGGVFINGRLYRGVHNAAGEVGYLYVHGMERMEPGGLGALEKRASGPGIADAARGRLMRSTDTASRLDPATLRSEDVWAAAEQGDRVAAEVIEETLDTLALGLANTAFMFDPELIVIGGGVGRVGDALLLPLRERVSALLIHPLNPRIELSTLGPRAQLYGAVSQALELARSGRESHHD